MQDYKLRRKPLTYGKSFQRQFTNLFFLSSGLEEATVSTTSPLQSDTRSSPRREQYGRSIEGLTESVATRTTINYCPSDKELAASNRTSLTDSEVAAAEEPSQAPRTTSSLFDFPSSDEEAFTGTIRKRRKLTPSNKKNKHVDVSDDRKWAVQALDLNSTISPLHSEEPARISLRKDSPCTNISSDQLIVKLKKPLSSRLLGARIGTHTKEPDGALSLSQSVTASHRSASSSSNSSYRARSPTTMSENRSARCSPSVQLISQLNASISQARDDLKQDECSGTFASEWSQDSHGQLGIRSLRITPERSPYSTASLNADEGFSGQMPPLTTPRRSRRRLVDALDSPRKPAHATTPQRMHDKAQGFATVNKDAVQHSFDVSSDRTVSELEAMTENEATKADEDLQKPVPSLAICGSKSTYARQRSHLSDMVEGNVKDLVAPLAMPLSQSTLSTKGSKLDGLEFQSSQDDQGDVDQGTSSIRSVHELRQGGVKLRFEKSLESWFEDIEASGSTAKARRLHSLCQLAEKVQASAFRAQLFDSTMDERLTTCATHKLDFWSSCLLSFVLATLLTSDQLPRQILHRIFDALMRLTLPPIIKDSRSFARVVIDRKYNLASAIQKEIMALEKTMLSSPMWNDQRPTRLTPQILILCALDLVIRPIRELGDLDTIVSLPVFDSLVGLLNANADVESASVISADSLHIVRLATSVLEYSSVSQESMDVAYTKSAETLASIGPLLTIFEDSSEHQARSAQQLLLRLILSITNNNALLCDSLSQPSLILPISYIVSQNFLQLSAQADAGSKVNEGTLESVILALGSLINFAEWSEQSRKIMYKMGRKDSTVVDWLIRAFTSRAELAHDVCPIISETWHGLAEFFYRPRL